MSQFPLFWLYTGWNFCSGIQFHFSSHLFFCCSQCRTSLCFGYIPDGTFAVAFSFILVAILIFIVASEQVDTMYMILVNLVQQSILLSIRKWTVWFLHSLILFNSVRSSFLMWFPHAGARECVVC
jgi:hypothetical protein